MTYSDLITRSRRLSELETCPVLQHASLIQFWGLIRHSAKTLGRACINVFTRSNGTTLIARSSLSSRPNGTYCVPCSTGVLLLGFSPHVTLMLVRFRVSLGWDSSCSAFSPAKVSAKLPPWILPHNQPEQTRHAHSRKCRGGLWRSWSTRSCLVVS